MSGGSAFAWVLSDGRPGHFNQSLGLLAALPVHRRSHRLVALPAPRRALKHLVLLCAWLAGGHAGVCRMLFRLYYGIEAPTAQAGCGLLVSTGGDTLVANVLLARMLRTPNVFLGKRSPWTDIGIRLLFISAGKPVPGRAVLLALPPSNTPLQVSAPPRTPPATVAVLIGGDSNEYRWQEDDFRALADALNALCARHGVRLLLTTSRRTGARGDELLRNGLRAEFLAEATWYATAPRPVMRDYCTQADIILCSEDSGTMLTEAIQFGRPVAAFHPSARHTTPFYEDFLARLRSHHVQFCAIPALAELALPQLPVAAPVDLTAAAAALAALLDGN